ncbi:Hypothetical Protein FCC1311_016932 [Hondaea fermentalgiana]|uniref:Major facilitator superfamily (MFS) profile domain-containing protein n=1 Tax=Hondaea fermentalgiana TaxID=2315210 RepID=A0A2R5GCI7_9STRA|nr:Hypothetical Protein FCC1311_016932 [Hondaea fermentalgiana]|eukprot:GBG25474.1 Hypothetical Protein FCC1311_016932 [Hondaea fermentalgiana]
MLGNDGGMSMKMDQQEEQESPASTSPISTASTSTPPPVSDLERNTGRLSKSMVEDFRRQQFQVLGVTFAVTTAAAVYVLMLFIAMPLSIHLIVNQEKNGCDPEISDDCFAATDESQNTLTLTLSLLRTMTFLMGGTMGVLSDRWGRRPVLLVALCGYATTGALFLIGWKVQTTALFILGGMILGAASPVTPHGYAYVSDVSRPDRLATNMGILQGGGYFLGLLTGALISLAISEATRGQANDDDDVPGTAMEPYNKLFNLSYSVGLCFAGLTCALMFFFLPESLHKDERKRSIDWKKANPFGFVPLVARSRYLLCLWISAAFGWMAVGASESVTGGWWLRRYTQSDVNLFIMFVVMIWLGSAFGAAIMTPIFVRVLGLKGSIHFTMIATILVGIGFAFSPTVNISYTAVGLSFLAAPVVPTQLSLIMGQVPATEKGALAGAIRSSEAFSKLIGIILLGTTFATDIEDYRPDVSCVPSDYSSSNPVNDCPCGVNTCPTYDPTNSSGRVMDAANPFYYEANLCSLGRLSPLFAGKPGKYVELRSPEPTPIVPQYFVDQGLVSREGTDCQGGGGLGDSMELELDRQWCISAESLEARGLSAASAAIWNQEYGCPGFDFGLYVADLALHENEVACEADLASPDCNQTLFDQTNSNPDAYNYDDEEFELFTGVYNNITTGVDATCETFGTGAMNLCWIGVTGPFPGLFPFVYFSGMGILAYLFFIAAEVFFRSEDAEFWLHKQAPKSSPTEESSTDNRASVLPNNDA